MFKIDKKTNKISMTKGDNAEILISVIDAQGKDRGVFDDDVITITVRQYPTDDGIVFTKKANGNVISLEPADTNTAPAGLYYYDIQLTTFTKKIYTIVPCSYFEILEEVTR